MSGLSAVLDACVLFPGSLRDTLLRSLEAGLYQGYWSEQILDELTRHLMQDAGRPLEWTVRLRSELDLWFPEAIVTRYETFIPSLTNDEKDRYVLAAAIATRAQVIVTFNLRDFPQSALVPYGIEAQHPDVFLANLYDLAPSTMATIISDQASDLTRPPQTVERVLARLGQHAPNFAALVQVHFTQDHDAPTPE